MIKGNSKILIANGSELINELGNNLFASNVSIPVSKLEENFKTGIVEELVERKLIKVEYGKPALRYRILSGTRYCK